jgi:hypothetical protein
MTSSWAERVRAAVQARQAANEPVWDLIDAINREKGLLPEDRDAYLGALYGVLSDKDVTQSTATQSAQFDMGTSFRSHINDLRRVKARLRGLGLSIFPGGNPKLKDRAYANSLGVPVPQTYVENIKLQEIQIIPGTIIKPVSGSSSLGVFFVDAQGKIHSIRTSETYESLDEASAEIDKYKDQISSNRWLVEEAILASTGKPAHDIKVYAFYGKPGMFLEIARGAGRTAKYATFDENGSQIGLGPRQESFPGTGLPEEIYTYVTKLSLAAPVPFLRLDFHKGADAVYLGEITPHPGGTYAGQLYENVDAMLGQHFADARARLIRDLLRGKKFPEFQAAYEVEL